VRYVLGERFGNLGNPFRTSWEQYREGQRKEAKKSSPPFLPKTIKLDPSCVHAEPIVGWMELLFSKLFVPIFGLG